MNKHSTNLGAAILLVWAGTLSAATFTVTNTNDSGPGSLRQAILDASVSSDTDRIVFNIPGPGVHTIKPTDPPMYIEAATIIDGYTQPGARPNTQITSDDAVLLIEINGELSGDGEGLGDGLVASATGTTIRGLVINRFRRNAVVGGKESRLEGCFIGTDPTGTVARSRAHAVGVHAIGSTIGGTLPAQRNVISGNDGVGIEHVAGAVIQGNFVGVDSTGSVALPNSINIDLGFDGYGNSVVIGGPALPAGVPPGNVISSAILDGVRITLGGYFGVPVTIKGNAIGTSADGTAAMPNGRHGVLITSSGVIGPSDFVRVGGADAAEGNVIAYNLGHGVATSATGLPVSIRSNSIHSNTGLGVDLGDDGVTPNVDGSPHNHPMLTAAVSSGGSTTILGTLNSLPNVVGIPIEFVSTYACDDSGYGEGATPIGSTRVSTDAGGHGSFSALLPMSLLPGSVVTTRGTSSEFSPCLAVTTGGLPTLLILGIAPTAGDAEGGTSVTVTGTGFLPGASLSIGGIPAGSVEVIDSSTIRATTPALPPGTLNDVSVANGPSGVPGLTATLPAGWISDFLDVPQDDIFHAHVERLLRIGITAGCGGGNYCRDGLVRRDQMAVFLLKAKHDPPYAPPQCTPPGYFNDLPCPGLFSDWVYKLVSEGIAGPCFVSRPPPDPWPPQPRIVKYCPLDTVRRNQMAAFLLLAKHGSDYVPPACSHRFADVPCPGPLADYVEQLAAEGITGGCGGDNFCPASFVTRGQMAVFLAKTFGLQ